MTYFDQVVEAASHLKTKLGPLAPKIGIVLGSGLGAVADAVPTHHHSLRRNSPLPSIHRRRPLRPHRRRIAQRRSRRRPCRAASTSTKAIRPSRSPSPCACWARSASAPSILTNAAGGIDESYRVGQLVALADHINFMGFNPLAGPNEPRFGFRPGSGLRFFDMTEAYSKALRALAQRSRRR